MKAGTAALAGAFVVGALLASEVVPPVGLMIVLLIGMVSAIVLACRVDSAPKQILSRLFPSLAGVMILLLAGAFALLWWQQHRQFDSDNADKLSEGSFVLRIVLEQQAAGLAAAAQPIAADPCVQQALREKDAARLLADWRPVFERLQRESHITHLYFFDASRTCLLRVHDPENRGDRIDRFTLMEAERTGKVTSGIELGSQGTFALRVVRPVFERGTLVGYVELGEEIEAALQTVAHRAGDQVVMTIRKEALNRQAWEDSMHRLGRKAEWDLLPMSVVAYSSLGSLPPPFISWANREPGEPSQANPDQPIRFDGKVWRPATMPMRDASGKEVGTLLILRDITQETAAFSRLLLLGGVSEAVLLALLLSFIYVLLRRTDMDLQAQQSALKESEKRFKDVLYSSQDAILLLGTDAFVDCNDATVKMLGYPSKAQVLSVHPANLSPPLQPDGRSSFEKADEMISTAIKKGYHRFEWVHRKATGEDFPVEVSITSVVMEGKSLLHCVWRDITEHKRLEGELVRERQLLRMIIDNIPDGIYAKDTRGRNILANRAQVESLGCSTEEELIGQTDAAFHRLDDAEKLLADDRAILASGEPRFRYEDSLTTADGDRKWILSSKMPLRDADGQIVGLLGIWHDITNRKLAEAAMKKRVELDVCLSEMIQSLLRGMKSGDGHVEALEILGRGNKASRTCLFQNSRQQDGSLFLRMVDQWSEKPSAFDPMEMPKPGILYPSGWAQIQECLASGECYCGDVRRWGEEERRQPWLQDFKTFLFAPIYVELQMGYRFWGFLAFVQNDVFREWDGNDIEIAKSAANLLGTFLTRHEEAELLYLLHAAIDSTQEAVVITDAQLDAPGPHIVFANPAVEKLSGYSHEELLGLSPRIFQGPKTNREALRRLREELPLGIPFQGITTNYRKDGTPYVVDWNIAPVRDQNGKIAHYVSVQRDITQQQAMEKRLAMGSKMESVGSLAAGIAHEINSPAQFIGDNVQFAYDAVCKAAGRLSEEGTALPPKIAQPLFEEVPIALKDALEGLSRIDKIVRSMREFAHPGEEMGPVDINRCLETSVTVCRNEWKHIAQVDFQLDPNLPPVLCVRSDVNQVVVNLVVNAAHAIAGQKRNGLGRILLSTRVHEGWAELRVEDDGPGVPPEIQEKIFDPFFTTKPVGQGTGQGLFLAQQSIVGKHCGRISLTNLPAGGASFLIQLPLHNSRSIL